MYEMADQSWRDQPKRMSQATADQTALRIGEHVRRHGLREIGLVLHGGEPLLAGPDFISYVVTTVRGAVGAGVDVHATVQTNGVRLDGGFLSLFDRLGVRIGVSLDGAPKAQDRHRRFGGGHGSYAAVVAGLRRLNEERYRHLFSGLLCVIDLKNDPLETYEALAAFQPPRVDFLLPHGTWESPPPGRSPNSTETPYADWLIRIFDYWYYNPETWIRLFADIMNLLLGYSPGTEAVGLSPASAIVIETDGTIEQVDTLKTAFHGASQTGLHVLHDPFDDALALPQVSIRQLGVRGLSVKCQECHINRVCGGGLYAHRYRQATGFANPSVYCPDLMHLITHVSTIMKDDISERITKRKRNGTPLPQS